MYFTYLYICVLDQQAREVPRVHCRIYQRPSGHVREPGEDLKRGVLKGGLLSS